MIKGTKETKAKEIRDKCSRQDMEALIQFEELISGLAATFVNLPICQVDKEIEHGLELMVNFLGADRGIISQFSEDKETLNIPHCYIRPGVKP